MDKIVYLSRAAGGFAADTEHAYEMRVCPIQDYCLIRVKLSDAFLALEAQLKRGSGRIWRKSRLQRKQRESLSEQFRRELAAMLDERDDPYCVIDKSLREPDLVRKLVPLRPFEGYLERDWVRRLLPYAAYNRFIVLGNAPYLPELLRGMASRMKSLVWILPDVCQEEMLEDFAEDFYQEYGLAIDMRYLGINESYGQLRVEAQKHGEPMNILDFTQDRHIPMIDPPRGSVWIDMAAMDEKEQKIRARRLNIRYYSLKKQWEQSQKAMQYPLYMLDTVRKNGYNTFVN